LRRKAPRPERADPAAGRGDLAARYRIREHFPPILLRSCAASEDRHQTRRSLGV